MTTKKPTPGGQALTDLVLHLFRLNNRLIVAGDRVVSPIGLTSARWKVMGTIVAAETPRPVAWLARDMGANRQNVQRIVNDLAADGLIKLQPNPHHRRASLVVLTEAGVKAFSDAMELQTPWINELARGLRIADIETTKAVVSGLCDRLEKDESP